MKVVGMFIKNFFAIIFTCYYLFEYIESLQISTTCKGGKYYDHNLFECTNCPENMIPRPDGIKKYF